MVKKMKSLCLVYPWFGKFNSYFDLWLLSAERNDTIDFLIYTDKDNIDYINRKFHLKPNIKLFESSLEKIASSVSKLVGGGYYFIR